MSATTLSASFGGIAGSDLEAELAQPRTADHDADEAAGFDRAEPSHDRQRDRRVSVLPAATGASARNDARRSTDYSVELRGVGKQYGERKVLSDFIMVRTSEEAHRRTVKGRTGTPKVTWPGFQARR